MIDGFPRLRQQTGWSCLPTAVLCVLEYQGLDGVTMDQVAEWCRVSPGGACLWDLSIQGLRDEFDVEDVEGNWEAIQEAVMENYEPVIVTIANPSPLAELVGDHAVVILGIEAEDSTEQVAYMDPSTGTYESKPLNEFLQWWDTPGQRGFLLRR